MRSWLSGKESSSFGWADLVVVPLVLVLSLPGLLFFGDNWSVVGNDSSRYLLAGAQFVSGQTLVGLKHLDEEASHRARREELAAAVALGAGEALDEVLVGASEDVALLSLVLVEADLRDR